MPSEKCVFSHMQYLKKEASFREKTCRTLFKTPKQNCMRNLERFWQSSILRKIPTALFLTEPFNFRSAGMRPRHNVWDFGRHNYNDHQLAVWNCLIYLRSGIDALSNPWHVRCPSVSCIFSNLGAWFDSSLAFGAETLRSFCTWRTMGPLTYWQLTSNKY